MTVAVFLWFLCCLVFLSACGDTAAVDNENSFTPKVGTFEPKLEEIYFIPILHNLEEGTMVTAATIAVEEVFDVVLSDSTVNCRRQEGEQPNYIITFSVPGDNMQYAATVDENQKAIVKLECLLSSELAPVSVSNILSYLKTAERLAGEKLLVKDMCADGAYVLDLANEATNRSVVVAFPDAALYVEIASDLSLIGYHFFDDTQELDTYLNEYTLPFG